MSVEMFVIKDRDGYYYISNSNCITTNVADATAFAARNDAKTLVRQFNRNTPGEQFEVVSVWRERVVP